MHWRTLARAKRGYRDACHWTAMKEALRDRRCFEAPVQAQVTFVVTDKRRRDSDNHMAMLKPMWDALVEMGVLEDDSHEALRIAEPKWERGPEKKVIVELIQYKDISSG